MSVPVVIGSTALKTHGYCKGSKDIDIICDTPSAQNLLWYADHKITANIFGFNEEDISSSNKKEDTSSSNKKEDEANKNEELFDSITKTMSKKKGKHSTPIEHMQLVDIVLYDKNLAGGKKIIYELTNAENINITKLSLKTGFSINVKIPPVEWLFALLRGHIHRIPKIFQSQKFNIKIWEKYMNTYHAIRDKYGYQKLNVLFESARQDEEPYKIYNAEFEYVNQVIGDAPSLEEKPEETFFKDNVERYIEHDKLHEQVAVINRGENATPLFTKFQQDPQTSVEMDQELFMKATPQERIDTLKEEIIVLFIERKALPAAVKFGQALTFSDESSSATQDFDEIVCHFITNLCGNGHYWLRQYAIDHWPLVNNISMYPKSKMCDFVNSFNHAGRLFVKDAPPSRIENLSQFVKYHEKVSKHAKNYNKKFL